MLSPVLRGRRERGGGGGGGGGWGVAKDCPTDQDVLANIMYVRGTAIAVIQQFLHENKLSC